MGKEPVTLSGMRVKDEVSTTLYGGSIPFTCTFLARVSVPLRRNNAWGLDCLVKIAVGKPIPK